MLKGASRAVLKIFENELHEAWRSGYQEGKCEVAYHAVPAILSARFGPEAVEIGGKVKTSSTPIGSRRSSYSPPPAPISSPFTRASCRRCGRRCGSGGDEAAIGIASPPGGKLRPAGRMEPGTVEPGPASR